MWKLVIEDDEGKRTVVPLTRDDYTIGRKEGNTIRLTERNVSRQHGRLRRKRPNGATKDFFCVEDHQSYNGIFVNGLRVAQAQDLQHGDLVQIGDYRLVLQDEAAAVLETAVMSRAATDPDAKATVPMGALRSQTLTDRPNRLVMLVGPTPGVEYPLDRERMTVGRAEEATISVNHNSVSRLHCEVHALGDGRFEIVDKGSSNGVRVNSVELKRSIIEAGDVIELGDVRFKFVGAGQVFVAGPNESQQLTAISDREAELVDTSRRGWVGYLVPVIGAGVVGAAIILTIVYLLRTRAEAELTPQMPVRADTEQSLVMEAKRSCTVQDCEAAFQRVTTNLGARSPWRDSPDFHEIVATWADSLVRRAQAESDVAARRALLQRVASEPAVDDIWRIKANDLLTALDAPAPTPNQLPAPVVAIREAPKDAGTTVTSAVVAPPPPTRTAAPHPAPSSNVAPSVTPSAATPPQPTAPRPPPSADERAFQAAIQGRPAEVRQRLEARVRQGHATLEEARLVKEACKQMNDRECRDDVLQKYPALTAK